jgi:Leucine-rich repeat (LRR) protein
LPHLQKLNLYNNRIKSLPDELKYLEHLHALYLGKNKLVQMPTWVGGLSKLRALDLSYNHLTRYEISLIEALMPNCQISY